MGRLNPDQDTLTVPVNRHQFRAEKALVMATIDLRSASLVIQGKHEIYADAMYVHNQRGRKLTVSEFRQLIENNGAQYVTLYDDSAQIIMKNPKNDLIALKSMYELTDDADM